MNRTWTPRLLALLLSFVGAAAAHAAPARLTVIHAIPGLPEPVEVFVNGDFAFAFDFDESEGPIALPAGTYDFEVKLQGDTVLSAEDVPLEDGVTYSAIAHLTYTGDAPGIKLSLFENQTRFDAPGLPRVSVRHTADAPAVDIDLLRNGKLLLMAMNVTNDAKGDPTNLGPVEVPRGMYAVSILPAGEDEPVFEADLGRLRSRTQYVVYAIGSIQDGSFKLFIEALRSFPLPPDDDDDDDDDDDGDDDDDDDDDGGDDDDEDDDAGDDDDD